MAASLPWRRDEKPAEISWLASDPGGTGPADHATSDDPRRYRVGTISTSNAIRAFLFMAGAVLSGLALSALAVLAATPGRMVLGRPFAPASPIPSCSALRFPASICRQGPDIRENRSILRHPNPPRLASDPVQCE